MKLQACSERAASKPLHPEHPGHPWTRSFAWRPRRVALREWRWLEFVEQNWDNSRGYIYRAIKR